MLRANFLHQWSNLSHRTIDEMLYDPAATLSAGIGRGRDVAPDETTISKFRHLLERHKLGRMLPSAVTVHLKEHGELIPLSAS